MSETAIKIQKRLREQAFKDISNEMDRQIEKFGLQNHPPEWYLTILMEEVGEAAKAALEHNFGFDTGTAGEKADNYIEELVQVAAVAISALLCFEKQQQYKIAKDEHNDICRDPFSCVVPERGCHEVIAEEADKKLLAIYET